eukprot:scaffold155218_cov30-Tisochrysis_lutea.AAC.1
MSVTIGVTRRGHTEAILAGLISSALPRFPIRSPVLARCGGQRLKFISPIGHPLFALAPPGLVCHLARSLTHLQRKTAARLP